MKSINSPDNIPLWRSFSLAILGMWLFASALGFSSSLSSQISDALSGLALLVLSIRLRKQFINPLLWVIASLGIWIQISSLVFPTSAANYFQNTLLSTCVIALSVLYFPMPNQLKTEPSIPPHWSYNPSSWPQRLPVALLAFLCWMISRYLAAYQMGYIHTVWDPFFSPGTQGVLTSSISQAFPVSDAGLGSLAYMIEFLSICQGGPSRWRTSPGLTLFSGFLVVPVTLVSVLLIILQPLAVGTWCTLCLPTALLALLGIPFAVDEIVATLQYLRQYSDRNNFWNLFWCGGSCPEAKKDTQTPSLTREWRILWQAGRQGVLFHWQLLLSTVIGFFLMIVPAIWYVKTPLLHLDRILGAFIVMVSIVSFAELLFFLRWLNLVVATALLFISWLFFEHPWLHSALASMLIMTIYSRSK